MKKWNIYLRTLGIACALFAVSLVLVYLRTSYEVTTKDLSVIIQGTKKIDILVNDTPYMVGDFIHVDDTITVTGDGIAEIILADNNVLRISSDTKLRVLSLKNPEIEFLYGNLWVYSKTPSVIVHAHDSTSVVANAIASFSADDRKVKIQSLYHNLQINLINKEKSRVVRRIHLPSKHELTLYKGKINDHFQALTPKKLRKELKQKLISTEFLKNDEWIQKNQLLDSTLTVFEDVYLESDTRLFFKDQYRSFIEAFLILPVEKRRYNTALAYAKYDEILMHLDSRPHLYKKNFSELETAVRHLLPHEQYRIFYDMYISLSAKDQSNYYLFTKDLYSRVFNLVYSKKEKEHLISFHSQQLINYLEEALISENHKLQNVFLSDLDLFVRRISQQDYAYTVLPQLRAQYMSLMVAYTEYLDLVHLNFYDKLVVVESSIVKKVDPNYYRDLQYEILESKLMIANYLIEKAGKFEFSLSYMRDQNLKNKISNLPSIYAAKGHLEEFIWIITQKGEKFLSTASNVKDEDFLSYIKKQKSISQLTDTLRETARQESQTPSTMLTDLDTSISAQDLEMIIKNFLEIDVDINRDQVSPIIGAPHKYLITNANVNQKTLSLKYDLNDDIVYEIDYNDLITSVGVKRIQFESYFEDKIDGKNSFLADNVQILSQSLGSPQDEALKLQKQIIQNELKKWDIYVQNRYIFPTGQTFDEFEIKNAQILDTTANFILHRHENSVSKIYLVNEGISINDTVHISDLVLEIENVRLVRQKKEQSKEEYVEMFTENDYIISRNDIEFVDEEFNHANISDARDKKISNLKLIGTFDKETRSFVSLNINGYSFDNIPLTKIRENYLSMQIKDTWMRSGFEVGALDLSLTGKDTVKVRDAQYGTFSVDCTFNLVSGECSKIVLDNSPFTMKQKNIPLDDLAILLTAKITETISEVNESTQFLQENTLPPTSSPPPESAPTSF